ncbi:hypothetical protein [Pseudomonas sp. DG56-2]|nr:hypothetical protein [Pseudomonas sp. DG56-2]
MQLLTFCAEGYLSALKVAVWGTQWARLQLAAEYGWWRACSTLKAAAA